MAAIGGIERDVSRRPSQPTADPARLQFSQSSVLPRGGECLETGPAEIVKSKSSINSVASSEQGLLVIDMRVRGLLGSVK